MTPMPSDFGFRWIGWAIWSNFITILMVIQGIGAAITLDPDLVPHAIFHWLLIGNAVLAAIIAQYKRLSPNEPEKTA